MDKRREGTKGTVRTTGVVRSRDTRTTGVRIDTHRKGRGLSSNDLPSPTESWSVVDCTMEVGSIVNS